MPVQMTWSGLNYDVLTGLAARALVLGWNLVGLALLANIVTIAVLLLLLPFRRFVEGPANVRPLHLPTVWLPTFLVQAAPFGHLLVFRKLWTRRRA